MCILFCNIHKWNICLQLLFLHGFVLYLFIYFCIVSLPGDTGPIYNSAFSQRAKQSELGLREPREVNNRLGKNYTADSSQGPHLQALVRKQTKLPSVGFNHVLMPGVAALPALTRFSLHFLDFHLTVSSSGFKLWSCWWADLQFRSRRTWETHTL